MWETKYIPQRTIIKSLADNEIFVFGSNIRGIHGAGAAKFAYENFGAERGVGFGPTGKCYAIPTKNVLSTYGKKTLISMNVEEIGSYVEQFILYTKQHPDLIFLVTEIGCGLAGHLPYTIAPLFKNAFDFPNVLLPEIFYNYLLQGGRFR
jgi:hypothetical protein